MPTFIAQTHQLIEEHPLGFAAWVGMVLFVASAFVYKSMQRRATIHLSPEVIPPMNVRQNHSLETTLTCSLQNPAPYNHPIKCLEVLETQIPDVPIEYAVKMVQFPEEAQLESVIANGEFNPMHINPLAETLAGFHGRIVIAGPDLTNGYPANVSQAVEENLRQIRPHLRTPADIEQLERLRAWSEAKHIHHLVDLPSRRDGSYLRECQGLMYQANMALLDDPITVFDCLEFNPNLPPIDEMSEASFLIMDLDNCVTSTLSCRFLNAWLAASGGYQGLRVLRATTWSTAPWCAPRWRASSCNTSAILAWRNTTRSPHRHR